MGRHREQLQLHTDLAASAARATQLVPVEVPLAMHQRVAPLHARHRHLHAAHQKLAVATAAILKHLQPQDLLLIEVVELVEHRLCERGGAPGAEGRRGLVPMPVAAHVDVDLARPLLEAAQAHHTHLEPVACGRVRVVALLRLRLGLPLPLRVLAARGRGGGGGRTRSTEGHLEGLGAVAEQPALDPVELPVDTLEARARHEAVEHDSLLHAG
eukprot:scaffold30991_cov64-Phaeocystis_antarctica.AAC.2